MCGSRRALGRCARVDGENQKKRLTFLLTRRGRYSGTLAAAAAKKEVA